MVALTVFGVCFCLLAACSQGNVIRQWFFLALSLYTLLWTSAFRSFTSFDTYCLLTTWNLVSVLALVCLEPTILKPSSSTLLPLLMLVLLCRWPKSYSMGCAASPASSLPAVRSSLLCCCSLINRSNSASMVLCFLQVAAVWSPRQGG